MGGTGIYRLLFSALLAFLHCEFPGLVLFWVILLNYPDLVSYLRARGHAILSDIVLNAALCIYWYFH